MKIVHSFLKRFATVSGAFLLLGCGVLLAVGGLLFVGKMETELTHEIVTAESVTAQTYSIGDIITLRLNLDSIAVGGNWNEAKFLNSDHQTIWDYSHSLEAANPGANGSYFLVNLTKSVLGNEVFQIKRMVPVVSSTGQSMGTLIVSKDYSAAIQQAVTSALLGVLGFFVFWSFYLYLSWNTAKQTLAPIQLLSNDLITEGRGISIDLKEDPNLNEIENVRNWFRLLMQAWVTAKEDAVANAKLAAIGEMAAQVAHDIRSPLAALEMATQSRNAQPEDVILRSAVERINNIANQLLHKNWSNLGALDGMGEEEPLTQQTIPRLVDSIVAEKKLQFRSKTGVRFELIFNSNSFCGFVKIQTKEFMRVLSNLINNAVESIEKFGVVTISIEVIGQELSLLIRDTGVGIPENVLAQLGRQRITFSKSNGSGLGFFSSSQKAKKWNGQLAIRSTVNVGTTVELRLPLSSTPEWFASEILLQEQMNIVVVDDDVSIHHMWDQRIKAADFSGVVAQVFHFYDVSDAERFLKEERTLGLLDNVLFLIDHEYAHSGKSGLEFIIAESICNRSILVTSHFEDLEVISGCNRHQVKLLPKDFAARVAIRMADVSMSKSKYDAILLDDDPLVHMSWKMSATKNGIQLFSCREPKEIFDVLPGLTKTIPIYIDSNLGNGVKGEDVMTQVWNMGFRNSRLATGYPKEKFVHYEWAGQVIGKEAPWT